MKRFGIVCALIAMLGLPPAASAKKPMPSASPAPLFFGIQPTSVTVSFGATAQSFNLQFYIVNNGPDSQALSNFSLAPVQTPANDPVTVSGYTNTCNGVIPAQGPSGVCNVFAQVSARGNQREASTIPSIAFQFSLTYGSSAQTLTSKPFDFTFATGTELPAAARTFTFINNCSYPVWFGIGSGAAAAITPNPTLNPPDPTSCVQPTDCYPASQCIAIDMNLSKCFWNAPAPGGGNFQLAAKGGTSSVTFPVYDNGIDAVWSGGAAGRTGCTGAGCASGDCGGGTGACPSGKGFQAPVSTAEFTLLNKIPVVYSNTPNGNTDADTYDVTVINGVSVPVSMAPTNGAWGGASSPYTCGTPGSAAAQSPLGACSWSFKPPSNDYVWVSLTTNPIACTNDSDCKTSPEVCGNSFNPGAAAGSQISKTCGAFLGYWTADAICAKDPKHNSALFPCTSPVQGTLTYFDLFGCTSGDLAKSCYSAGAVNTCCGCVEWSGVAGVGVPPAPITATCNAINPNWTRFVQSGLEWVKAACPTAYSYPFDDASSTFTCPTASASGTPTDYSVTFCPGAGS